MGIMGGFCAPTSVGFFWGLFGQDGHNSLKILLQFQV
jgi:hypothetical protein